MSKLLLSVRARSLLKAAALGLAEAHREKGSGAFSARDFLAMLLTEVTDAQQQAVIMAHLQPVGKLSRVQSLCGFERCGQLTVPGLLFCESHLHDAAIIDQRLAKTEGYLLRCNFDGINPDGTRGCSLFFRHPTSPLCHFHRSQQKPKRTGEGASITPLPLTRATKRSERKKPHK